jgi:hypothetical protein
MGGRRFLAISKPYVYRLDARLTEGQPDEAIVRQFWFYFPEKVVRSEEAHPPSNFSGGQLIGSHVPPAWRAGDPPPGVYLRGPGGSRRPGRSVRAA